MESLLHNMFGGEAGLFGIQDDDDDDDFDAVFGHSHAWEFMELGVTRKSESAGEVSTRKRAASPDTPEQPMPLFHYLSHDLLDEFLIKPIEQTLSTLHQTLDEQINGQPDHAAQCSSCLDVVAASLLSGALLRSESGQQGTCGELGHQAVGPERPTAGTRDLWAPMMERIRVVGLIGLGSAAIQAFFSGHMAATAAQLRPLDYGLEATGSQAAAAEADVATGAHGVEPLQPPDLLLETYFQQGDAMQPGSGPGDVVACIRKAALACNSCEEGEQPVLSGERREQLLRSVTAYMQGREAELQRFGATLKGLGYAADSAAVVAGLLRALQGPSGTPALRVRGLLCTMGDMAAAARGSSEPPQMPVRTEKCTDALRRLKLVDGSPEAANPCSPPLVCGGLASVAADWVQAGICAALQRFNVAGWQDLSDTATDAVELSASQLAAWSVLACSRLVPEERAASLDDLASVLEQKAHIARFHIALSDELSVKDKLADAEEMEALLLPGEEGDQPQAGRRVLEAAYARCKARATALRGQVAALQRSREALQAQLPEPKRRKEEPGVF